MTHTLERISKTQLRITARAPYQELEPLLDKAAGKISEETEFQGFRRGKAPYDVVKAAVGEFKVLEEAARIHIERNFERILSEAGEAESANGSFEPVGEPQVVITKLAPGEEFVFTITLAILPPIELPDYRAIALRVRETRRVPETTPAEVDAAIGWLRESRTALVTVRRGAAPGDRVEIDFQASAGGVPLEGAGSKNHPIVLGTGRFPAGFEGALAGMRSGEERTFALDVPANWRDKAIAGKHIEVTAKMNLVQERNVPEWDDEFARSLGTFGSAAAARQSIVDGLQAEKEEKERERLRIATAEAIAEETTADIPASLVERELDKMLTELKDSIGGMGLSFEDYLLHLKKTEAGLRGEWQDDAIRRVKIALVLREIARRERIEPTEEDVQAAINRTISHRGMGEEELKSLDREAFIRYHVGIARNEKVFQFLDATP